jgi:hypothetical protein
MKRVASASPVSRVAAVAGRQLLRAGISAARLALALALANALSCGGAAVPQKRNSGADANGWIEHAVGETVHLRTPPSFRVERQQSIEHIVVTIADPGLEIQVSAGHGFVNAVSLGPQDTRRYREQITIAGHVRWIDSWRREPPRIAGMPLELECLIDLGGVQVSAHATCRDEGACQTARSVIASIQTRGS